MASLAAGVIAAIGGVGAGEARAAVDWRSCGEPRGFQCGTLEVPLDYDEPAGPKVSLALIRHRATDPGKRKRSLLINAGGPGGSTVTAAPLFTSRFPARVRARYDIVGFDPRGIGASDQLRCFDTFKEETKLLSSLPPGQIPLGPAEIKTTLEVFARFGAQCARNSGPMQFHMSTANVARDMDRVRAAVGDRKLNYYGPSYGTYLGATYLNLFPRRAGRVILDGNVPPVEWNDAEAARTQDTFRRIGSPAGNEEALQRLLRVCGLVGRQRCAFSAGSPSATAGKYRELLTRLAEGPVTVNGVPHPYGLAVSRIGSGMFTQAKSDLSPGWKGTARLMQAFWKATTSPGRKVRDARAPALPKTEAPKRGFPPELLEGTSGVLCGESPNPDDPNVYAGTSWPLGVGAAWTWLAAPCAGWTARDQDAYAGPWDRATITPLLIGTRSDPNTNYTGTLKLARQLGRGRVLTEAGGGHTALLNPSRCIDRRVARYLLDGTLPRPGTVCRQDKPAF